MIRSKFQLTLLLIAGVIFIKSKKTKHNFIIIIVVFIPLDSEKNEIIGYII